MATVRTERVHSLVGLQALVQSSGDQELVIEVVGPLKLGEAPGIDNLLGKMEKLSWKITGVSKLEPLIPVAITIQKASQIVCKLIPFFEPEPEEDRIVLDLSHDPEDAKIRRLTKKLERLGKDLLRFDFEDTKWLGDDLLDLVKTLKRPVKNNILLDLKLRDSKKCCKECYNMLIFLDGVN